jgi:long-chain acyl-CoA synthetase
MESIFETIRARRHSLSCALIGDNPASYAELISDAEKLGRHLCELSPPATGGVLCGLPHGREFVTAMLATRFAGGVFVPLGHHVPQSERNRIIAEVESQFILVNSETVLGADYSIVSTPLPGCSLWCSNQHARRFETDDAIVIFSSGSTGRPKGVILSDGAVSTNVRAVADYLSLTEEDRIVAFTPPHFAYAISQMLTHLYAGAKIGPWPGGLLNLHGLWREFSSMGITGLQANPSIYSALFANAEQGVVLDSVRYVMSGGQPLSSDLVRTLLAVCPRADVINMYGCTENSPRVSYYVMPKDINMNVSAWPVGKSVAGTCLRVFNGQGNTASVREIGEVAIKGRSLFRNYLGSPELKTARMVGDWFMTRDLGYIDDSGDLVLTGRADNIMLVGHEKVSPEEIEALLTGVDGIIDVAVGPSPHRKLYQVPVALVVTENPLSEVKLRALTRLNCELSRAKIPRDFLLVGSIPRTPYGKIDRGAVRDQIATLVAPDSA